VYSRRHLPTRALVTAAAPCSTAVVVVVVVVVVVFVVVVVVCVHESSCSSIQLAIITCNDYSFRFCSRTYLTNTCAASNHSSTTTVCVLHSAHCTKYTILPAVLKHYRPLQLLHTPLHARIACYHR
jgi:hypothetical protein